MKRIKFIFLLILLSCGKENESRRYLVRDVYKDSIVDDKIFLSTPRVAEINSNETILSYDKSLEQFQVFDLNAKKVASRINLEFFGPNAVPQNLFSSILFKDKLLISSSESLVVVSLSGEKEKEIFYDKILDDLEIQGKRISPIYRSNWDPVRGDVYLWVKDLNSHTNQFQSYKEKIQLIRYSLLTDSSEILSLDVPQNLIDNDRGYYSSFPPLVSVYDGNLVYAFSYLPDVFYYNVDSRKGKKFLSIPSNFHKTPPVLYKNYSELNLGKVGNSTQFIDLIFDPSGNRILRKHRQYIDGASTGEDGLMIIELDNTSEEVKMEEKIGRLFHNSDFIIALDLESKNEDVLSFFKFKIEKVKD